MIRVNELRDNAHPNEATAAAQGEKQARKSKFSGGRDISWIRFPSLTSTFEREARPGDLMIRLWMPLSSKHLRVCPPATLLAIRKEPTCFRMYIEEASFRMRELPFGKFTAMAKKAGISRPICKTSSRRLKAEEASALFKRGRPHRWIADSLHPKDACPFDEQAVSGNESPSRHALGVACAT